MSENAKGAPKRPNANPQLSEAALTLSPARPALHVVIELEEDPLLFVAAANLEDELRLRAWLRRSSILPALPGLAHQLLDLLDSVDEGRAA